MKKTKFKRNVRAEGRPGAIGCSKCDTRLNDVPIITGSWSGSPLRVCPECGCFNYAEHSAGSAT